MTTRMIERWFPCAEVSKHSAKRMGYRGFAEKSLFTVVRVPTPRPGEGSRHLLSVALA